MANKSATLMNTQYEVPVWHKLVMNLEETMAYSGISRPRLSEMTLEENCPFVLWIGKKRFIKRKLFDEYIAKAISI